MNYFDEYHHFKIVLFRSLIIIITFSPIYFEQINSRINSRLISKMNFSKARLKKSNKTDFDISPIIQI